MSKELLRTRIGNTVTVVLPVLTRGDAVSLVGRDITIMLVDPNDVKTPVSFTVGGVDNNIATFVVEGTSQSATGTYRAEVYENYRGTAMAVYDCDIFVLVARTEYENDGNEGVSSETTTIDPINIAWVGRDGYTPYIQDGYWYINGTSTNFKAAGENGDTPYIENGYWYIGGVSTGIKVDYTNEEAQRAASEQVRVAAEAARVQAEAARTLAENSRLTEESGRSAAEGVRILAERDRQAAEATRQTQEEIRHDNEEARVEAELGRAASEASRAQVEATRVANETARTTAEATRAANEQTRASNETDRAAAETARIAAETARETAEDGRTSAEATRVSNEQTRVSNESTRQSNESARQAAESARQAAYVAAEDARDAAFAAKEATRDAANEAALNCAETLSALGLKIDQVTGGTTKNPIITTGKALETGEIYSSGACDIYSEDISAITQIKTLKTKFNAYASPHRVGWRFLDINGNVLTYGNTPATQAEDNGKWFEIDIPNGAVKFENSIFRVNLGITTVFEYEGIKFDGIQHKVELNAANIVNLTESVADISDETESIKRQINGGTYITEKASGSRTFSVNYGNLEIPVELVSGELCRFNAEFTGSASLSLRVRKPNTSSYIEIHSDTDSFVFDWTAPHDVDSIIVVPTNVSGTCTLSLSVSSVEVVKALTEDLEQEVSRISNEIDNPVKPESTTFFIVAKNLFDPSDCSYFDAWGSSNQGYHTTGLIDVSEYRGKTLYFSYNDGVRAFARQMKVFNANQTDITYSGGYADEGNRFIGNVRVWQIPNDVYYIQCAISTSFLDENNATKKFQIEANDTGIHPYIPFGQISATFDDTYLDIDSLKEKIFDTTSNVAQLTSKLYVTDKRTDLFFSPLFKNWQHIGNRFCRVSATGATIYRQFKDLVTIDATANGTLTFKTYDDSFNVIDTKEVATVFTSQSKIGSVNAMFIGSSITAHGIYEDRLKTLCGEGFAAIGTRHSQTHQEVFFEGVGGWGFASFAKYVTSKTNATSPFWHPSNGRYWGVVGFWKDVMTYNEWDNSNPNDYVMSGRKTTAIAAGFGSDGYITGSRLQTNDIMYDDTLESFVQWNGSAWTQISTPATWGFDFVKYGNMWNISAPDVFVMAELSTNDFRTSSTNPNFTTWNSNAEAMITALKVWKADINIVMIIPISTFGLEHSLGEFVQLTNFRMYQSRINQIEHFDNREDEGIYLIDDAIFFDEEYGYPLSSDANAIKPNQEYNGNETLRVQTGSPHPNEKGEFLLADGMFGIIQHLRG